MRNNHSVIANAYFFISEAIILFFIALPFFHILYNEVPYWRYLVIAVIMCTIFIYFYKTKNYAPYLFVTAIAIGSAFFIGIPLFFAIVLPIVLVWRFIQHREGKVEIGEKNYLMIGAVASLILGVWLQQIEIVFYIILLFSNIILGHLLSHLTVTAKEDQKQFEHRTWFYLLGSFAVVGIFIYFFFDVFRGVITQGWLFIQYLLIKAVHLLARIILPLFDIDIKRDNSDMELDAKLEGDFKDVISNQSVDELPKYFLYIVWGIGIIIALLIVYYIYRLMKKRFTHTEEEAEEIKDEITYEQLTDQDTSSKKQRKRTLQSFFEKSMHPARKVVLNFEKQAKKNGYGRNKTETIEEWFRRLKVSTDFLVYQKVRYGDLDVSDEEMQVLKNELAEIETRLKR